MQPVRSLLTAAGVAVALLTGGATTAVAATAPTPPPRVVDLEPRIVDLNVRIIDLKPKRTKHTYTVDADVLFAFDSAKLSPEASNVLDDIVATLEKEKATRVTITGYTDSIGSAGYNQSLSRRRAGAVRDHLEGRAGGPRYAARGHGEANPVAANTKPGGADNPDGRRKNRRVVITYTTG